MSLCVRSAFFVELFHLLASSPRAPAKKPRWAGRGCGVFVSLHKGHPQMIACLFGCLVVVALGCGPWAALRPCYSLPSVFFTLRFFILRVGWLHWSPPDSECAFLLERGGRSFTKRGCSFQMFQGHFFPPEILKR